LEKSRCKMTKCNCTMTQKLVGDGCQKCNPALVIDMLELNIQDLEQENAQLQLDNAKLREEIDSVVKDSLTTQKPTVLNSRD